MPEEILKTTDHDPLAIPEKRAIIDSIIDENRSLPGATMVVLNQIQQQIGYITAPMQVHVAKQLRVPVGTIHGVVTFYSFFTKKLWKKLPFVRKYYLYND